MSTLMYFVYCHYRLPEDYRFFLTLIGNGGQCGPCFEGVLPLGVFPFTSDPGSLLNNLPDLFPFTEPSILVIGGGQQQQDSGDDDTDLSDTTSDDNEGRASTDDSLDDISGNTYSSSDNNNNNDDDCEDSYDDDDDDDDKYMTSYSLEEELYPSPPLGQQQQQQLDDSIKQNGTITVGGYLILGTLAQDRQYFWILICGGACRGEVWIMNIHGFYYPTSRRLKFYQWIEDWLLGGNKINASLWACGLHDPHFTRCFQSGIDNAVTSESGSEQEEDYGNSSDSENDSNSGYSYDDL